MIKLTDTTTKELAVIEDCHNRLMKIIPNTVTPAFRAFAESPDKPALAAALGNNAGAVFAALAKLIELGAIMGYELPQPSGDWTPNADGTVTYTAPEPDPDPEP